MPSFHTQVEMAVPASRVWAFLIDSNTQFPKIAPLFIASIDVVEGVVGQVGEVTLVTLGPIAPDGAFVKEKKVVIEHDTMTMASEQLEGGHLAVGFSKWVATLRIVPLGDDKSKILSSVEYETEGDSDVSLAITQAKDGLPMLFHTVEQYLASPPHH